MIGRAGLLLMMLVPTAALYAAASHAAEPAATPADADKPICKTQYETGSRVRAKKICLTKEEWDKLAQETAKGMNDISRSASRIPQSGSIMTN